MDSETHLGLIQYRRARQTGRYIGVYDGELAGMDCSDGKWQTVCEDHGTVICHPTKKVAKEWAVSPLTWCEACQEEDKKKHGYS